MATALLVSPIPVSLTHPFLGVADWLKKFNHQPIFLSWARSSAVPVFQQSGHEYVRSDFREAPLPYWPTSNFAHLFEEKFRYEIEPIRKVIRKTNPKLVALDPNWYPAVIAAQIEKVPFVSMADSLDLVTPPEKIPELAREFVPAESARTDLFAKAGVEASFRLRSVWSPSLNTVFTTQSFVGTQLPLPRKTYLVGHSQTNPAPDTWEYRLAHYFGEKPAEDASAIPNGPRNAAELLTSLLPLR